MEKLGELSDVTGYSKIYNADDMQGVIDAIEFESKPAARDEATTMVALLLSSYPHARGQLNDGEWQQAQLRLFETFSGFPAAIGFAAVDPLKGIPSQKDFLPKPFDIVKFCQAQQLRMNTAKVMARRHITECKRRAAEDAERVSVPEKTLEERRAFVARIMGQYKLRNMDAA